MKFKKGQILISDNKEFRVISTNQKDLRKFFTEWPEEAFDPKFGKSYILQRTCYKDNKGIFAQSEEAVEDLYDLKNKNS